MKTIYSLTIALFFIFLSTSAISQTGINTINPDPSSILEVFSGNAGVLFPRMTETERVAIGTPATGLLVYQTDNSDGFWFFDGTAWQMLGSGSGWELEGNAGTDPTINSLGTTDAEDFVVRADDNEAIRISGTTGNIGVGTTTPQAPLHMESNTIAPLGIRDGSQRDGRVLTSNADGDASWEDTPVVVTNDDDWIFASGNTINDPIYREGSVSIGTMSPTTHTVLVDTGDPAETAVRFGSVEVIRSRTNAMFFSAPFLPLSDNNLLLGSPTNRWTEFWAGDGVIQTSDQRDKESIKDLNIGLKEVLALEPVSFQWKEERVDDFVIPNDQRRTHLGFIAQDIQEVIPEIVETYSWKEHEESPGVLVKKESDIIGVNYSEMIPVLVKSIQEQEEILRELEKQNKELKKVIEKVKK